MDLIDLIYFSQKCPRVKVKTRKKISQTLRCMHEVVVGFLEDAVGPQDTPGPEKQLKCCNCGTSFGISTGGRCLDCKSQTVYCSRECQVKLVSYLVMQDKILPPKSNWQHNYCTLTFS